MRTAVVVAITAIVLSSVPLLRLASENPVVPAAVKNPSLGHARAAHDGASGQDGSCCRGNRLTK